MIAAYFATYTVTSMLASIGHTLTGLGGVSLMLIALLLLGVSAVFQAARGCPTMITGALVVVAVFTAGLSVGTLAVTA